MNYCKTCKRTLSEVDPLDALNCVLENHDVEKISFEEHMKRILKND